MELLHLYIGIKLTINGIIILLAAFKLLTLNRRYVMLAIMKLLLLQAGKVHVYQLKLNGKLLPIILIGVNAGNGPKVLTYLTPALKKKKEPSESITESSW